MNQPSFDDNSDLDLVKQKVAELAEHFDSVQIFTTRHEPTLEGGTINIGFGSGCWFTRYGQVREWLVKCDENSRMTVRKDAEEL